MNGSGETAGNSPRDGQKNSYQTFPAREGKPVAQYERLPKAEIGKLGGAPVLMVNGLPENRIGIASTSDNQASLAEKLDCGMVLVKTKALPMGGPAMREEFYAQLNASVAKILDAIPDARIILRLNIQPTTAFLEAHPESRVTGANGETVYQEKFNRYFEQTPRYRSSWASMKWREACDPELRDVVEYVSRQPYAGHIIGALLSAGHTGEFDQWFGGEGWPGGNPGDWCPESLARFQQWLGKKYNYDLARLRKAWGNPDVTFETAWIEKTQVPVDKISGFGNPAANRARADYDEYFALQIPETIESWSRTVKQAAGGRWVVGGMRVGCEYDASGLINTSPWIDFAAGPGTYFNREPGNHTRHDFSGEDQRRNGKWFLDEMDVRTFLWGNVVGAKEGRPAKTYGVDSLERTLSVLQREHAEVTLEGMGGYWYEFNGTVYRDPAIWKLFRRQSAINDLASRHDRSVPTDVAVVLGDGAGDMRSNVLPRLGTPYHSMTFSTLMRQDPATLPYRVYLFFNIATVTASQRDYIRANLQKHGNWLVFFRPIGIYCPEAEHPFDLTNSTALHGITLAPKTGDRKQNILTVVSGVPLPDLVTGSDLAEPFYDIGSNSGSDTGATPVPRPAAWTVVNDPAAIPLAIWKDGSVAAAMKKYRDWTAVYVSSQRVCSPFIRSIVKASGAHQYLDNGDDVIFAAGPLLAFHTRTAGVREIKLREAADLYDLYADKMIGQGQQTYSVPMLAKETYLFYLGDPRKELTGITASLDAEILQRRMEAEAAAKQRMEKAAGEVSPGPYRLFANGKMTAFLFLGPVPLPDVPADQVTAYEKAQLPLEHLANERGMHPACLQKQKILDGGESLTWQPLVAGPGRYFVADYIKNPDRKMVVYVATYLQSSTGGTYTLNLRTERGNHVYFDGKKIGECFSGSGGQTDFPLTLEAGKRHLLLVKIFASGGGNSGWRASLTNKDGKPDTDVTAWLAE
jgi:hypothetical protein